MEEDENIADYKNFENDHFSTGFNVSFIMKETALPNPCSF